MTDKDIDLIIKFLENELSAQEVEEFKAKYGHDVEFTREVNERSKIYISLEAASKVSLKNMAEEPLLRRFIGNKTPPLNADYRISNKWLYRIAAVLIPLIALTIGMELWVRPRLSTDDLYLTYSQKLQAKGEFRSFTGDQKTNFGQLQKDIDNAILESIDALQGTADIHAFGLYCMEGKRFTEAVYAFRRVEGMNEKFYRESSEWHLGLCYLKLGDMDKAKMVFSSIANTPDHKFRKESKELLRRIK